MVADVFECGVCRRIVVTRSERSRLVKRRLCTSCVAWLRELTRGYAYHYVVGDRGRTRQYQCGIPRLSPRQIIVEHRRYLDALEALTGTIKDLENHVALFDSDYVAIRVAYETDERVYRDKLIGCAIRHALGRDVPAATAKGGA